MSEIKQYSDQGDFTDKNIQDELRSYLIRKPDVVISDMAVNTTGIKKSRLYKQEVCKKLMYFAKKQLSKWFFVSKILWAQHSMKLSH